MKTSRDIKRWADLIGGTYASATNRVYVVSNYVEYLDDSITLKTMSASWHIANDDMTVISLPLVGRGDHGTAKTEHRGTLAALNTLLKQFQRDSWHDLDQLDAPLIIFWPEAHDDFQVKMMTTSDSREDPNKARHCLLDDPDGVITSWLRGDLTDGMILDWVRDQLHAKW